MHPVLLSGDLFLFDGSRSYIRFLPRDGRDAEGSAGLTSPDAFISTTLLPHFARKLGELPEAKLECCVSEQGSFALLIHRPPNHSAFDESMTLSITLEDVRRAWEATRVPIPAPSDLRKLLNGPGHSILLWLLPFFVRVEPKYSLKDAELSWTAKIPPRIDARM